MSKHNIFVKRKLRQVNIDLIKKPLFLMAGIIGLILGVISSLLFIPFSSITTNSSNDIISTTTATMTDFFLAIIFMVQAIMISCLAIALVIFIGLLFFNWFCRIINN